MGHRDPRVRGRGDARGDPGHDLERRLRRHAAAPPPRRRGRTRTGRRPSAARPRAPRCRAPPAAARSRPVTPTGRRPPCPRTAAPRPRRAPSSARVGDQPVVDDHVGGGDQLERPRGQQARISGTRADQVDGHDEPAAETGAVESAATGPPAVTVISAGCRAAPRAREHPLRAPRHRAAPGPRAPHRAAKRSRRAGRPTRSASATPVVQQPAMGPDRRLAAGPERVDERSLGGDARHRGGIVDGVALGSAERLRARLQAPARPDRRPGRAVERPAGSIRAAEPLEPASASTSASASPSASLRSRVSTLPRTRTI